QFPMIWRRKPAGWQKGLRAAHNSTSFRVDTARWSVAHRAVVRRETRDIAGSRGETPATPERSAGGRSGLARAPKELGGANRGRGPCCRDASESRQGAFSPLRSVDPGTCFRDLHPSGISSVIAVRAFMRSV